VGVLCLQGGHHLRHELAALPESDVPLVEPGGGRSLDHCAETAVTEGDEGDVAFLVCVVDEQLEGGVRGETALLDKDGEVIRVRQGVVLDRAERHLPGECSADHLADGADVETRAVLAAFLLHVSSSFV
jgi:hypothetical protein